MDLTWADPAKRRLGLKLEMFYLGKLGELMQRCTEKLLVILLVHFRALLQAEQNVDYPATREGIRMDLKIFADAVSAALDYTKIDTLRVGGANGNNAGACSLRIGQQLRDEMKKLPKM